MEKGGKGVMCTFFEIFLGVYLFMIFAFLASFTVSYDMTEERLGFRESMCVLLDAILWPMSIFIILKYYLKGGSK